MKSLEQGRPRLELSNTKLRRWATIAALGIVLLLASCGTPQASSQPLEGEVVVHAIGAESWDGQAFGYGENSGRFDVVPSGLGITESAIVKPSTLCDDQTTSSFIEMCNSINSLAQVLGMSEPETADLRGRIFVVDTQTMASIYPGPTGLTIPEYQNNQLVGKGLIVFPDFARQDLSPLAHEFGHLAKNEGELNLKVNNRSNKLLLGNENVSEDKSCVKIVDEAATVCTEVEPGRSSCSTSNLTELRADIFANIVTARARGCTANNWTEACGVGEYSGYLSQQDDVSSQLTRAETASLMQTMRMYYLSNPAEFDAWVKMQRSGEFVESWQQAVAAFGFSSLTPEQAYNKLIQVDSAINFYSGSIVSPVTHSDEPSIQAFCEQ